MATSQDQPPKSSPLQGLTEPSKQVISSIADLAKEVIRDAPPLLKVVVFLAASCSIILVIFSLGFFVTNSVGYALAALVIAVVPPYWVVSRLLKMVQAKLGSRVVWRRFMPNLGMVDSQIQSLSETLDQMRESAVEKLKLARPDIPLQRHQIRANIFLPDYRDAGDGYAYRLYMPAALRKGMDYPPEWGIRFRPGEGATGVVFLEGSRRITDSREFQLMAEHIENVHRDLKWVITLPVQDPNDRTMLGVLNIDGLQHEFPQEVLSTLADDLTPKVRDIERVLGSQSKVALTLAVEE